MGVQHITEKEKSVVLSVCSQPRISDRIHSNKLNMKSSTFYNIKRSLEQKEIIIPVRIPNYYKLGVKSLSITTGYYKLDFPLKLKDIDLDVFSSPSIPFFSYNSNNLWFTIGVLPEDTFASANPALQNIFEEHRNNCSYNIGKLHFPAELTTIHRFYDFKPILEYEINKNIITTAPIKGNSKQICNYSKLENELIIRLINSPNESDYKLSQDFDVSHPTLTKMRKRFLDENLFEETFIPNVRLLGFSSLAWFVSKIPKDSSADKSSDYFNEFNKIPQLILGLSNRKYYFGLTLLKTLKDFTSLEHILLSIIRKYNISRNEPLIHLLPLDDSKVILKNEYDKPVTRILNHQFTNNRIKNLDKNVLESRNIEYSDNRNNYLNQDLMFFENINSDSLDKILFLNHKSKDNMSNSISQQEQIYNQHFSLSKLIETEFGSDENTETALAELNLPIYKKYKKVLLIGDSNDQNILTWQKLFKNKPFTILKSVDNFQDSICIYRNSNGDEIPIDMIIFDLKESEKSECINVIKEIFKIDNRVKIIVVVSKFDHQFKKILSEIGVTDYLLKPLKLTYFNKVISNI